jgi:hypothetical protein
MKIRNVTEQMVWATVYAMHVEQNMFIAPYEYCLPGKEDMLDQHELNVAVQACERADAAVLRLREAKRERS